MKPLVSVVIPSYNHERYLGLAIASVLRQTHDALELIVVDDGSRDQSVSVLQGIRDPRFRYVTQENRGAHEAINRGLSMANGGLLAILNSDDVFLPERLKRAVAAFSDEKLWLWGSYLEVIGSRGESVVEKRGFYNELPHEPDVPEATFIATDDLRLNLLQSNYWSTTSNYVFRRHVLEEIGAMRPLRFAHDWDFAMRAQQRGRAALEREVLLKYRVHATNTISSNRLEMIFEVLWVLGVHMDGILESSGLGTPDSLGAERLRQLSNSLNVHGCWRTFSLMRSVLAASGPDRELCAEALLDPRNPMRQVITAELEEELKTMGTAYKGPVAAPSGLKGMLPLGRRLWQRLM